MARIPEVEIERLKKEIAIERLVMGFGIELKWQGAELVGGSTPRVRAAWWRRARQRSSKRRSRPIPKIAKCCARS